MAELPGNELQKQDALNLLESAENLFGPAINDWSFVGIEFNNMGPHIRYYPVQGEVTISLSLKAVSDKLIYDFQLSHEACHLLHPSRENKTGILNRTTVLNEGLSTLFQSLAIESKYNLNISESLATTNPDYLRAMNLVKTLIDIYPGIIKDLRSIEPRIDKINGDHFKMLPTTVSRSLIDQLIVPFK